MRVLEELRRLEDAQGRGEVDETEVQKLRDDILSMVEDAEVSDTHDLADVTPPTNPLWHIVGLTALGLIAFTGLMAWLFNDLSMGITLGIAALAVVVIRAAQMLEDNDETRPPSSALDDSLPE